MKYVIDIDGTVADASHRSGVLSRQDIPTSQKWGMFFQPELMKKDPFIDASKGLNELMARGNEVVFMTGRPERTRQPTVDWLRQHFSAYDPAQHKVFMKNDGDFGATSNWKAEKLRELHPEGNFQFIDDDESNRARVTEEFPSAQVYDPAEGGWAEMLKPPEPVQEQRGAKVVLDGQGPDEDYTEY